MSEPVQPIPNPHLLRHHGCPAAEIGPDSIGASYDEQGLLRCRACKVLGHGEHGTFIPD